MASSSSNDNNPFSDFGMRADSDFVNTPQESNDTSMGFSFTNDNQAPFSFTSPNSFSFIRSNSSPSFLINNGQQASDSKTCNSSSNSFQKRSPKKSPSCSRNIFNISFSDTGTSSPFKFSKEANATFPNTTTPFISNTQNTTTPTTGITNPNAPTTTLSNVNNSVPVPKPYSSYAVVTSSSSSLNFPGNSPGFAPPKFGGSVFSVPTFTAPTATFSSHSTQQNNTPGRGASTRKNGFKFNNESFNGVSDNESSNSQQAGSVSSSILQPYLFTTCSRPAGTRNSPILRPATFTPPKNSPSIFRGFGSSGIATSSTATSTTFQSKWVFPNASSSSTRTTENGFLNSLPSSPFSAASRKLSDQGSSSTGASVNPPPRPESPLFQSSRSSTTTPSFDFAQHGKEWNSSNSNSFFNPNVKKKESKQKDTRSTRSKHRSKDNETNINGEENDATTSNITTTDQQNAMKGISTLNDSVREFKVLLRELNGIRAFNDMRTISMMIESLEKNMRALREAFKCDICFLAQYNHFYFCPDCGRLVGCFLCAYRMDRCPTCRKRLPPKKNRAPHVIPGLAAALDEKEISRDELWKQVEKVKV